MSQYDNVSVTKKANIYFDGRCISHTVVLNDGSRKSLGVLLPSTLTFNTGSPEVMELLSGHCRVRLAGSESWVDYRGGQSFEVPGQSKFDIEILEITDYVCHFG